MFFFPFLFLYLVFILLISPLLIWGAVPPRWHTQLAILYGGIACLVLAVWIRNIVQEWRQTSRHPAGGAHWRWAARTPAELFRRRIDLFLGMRGWRILSSCVTGDGRVELIVQKERCTLVLLCVGPRPPPAGALDLQLLQAQWSRAHATLGVLVTSQPCGQAALAAITHPLLLLLRYQDLERLDDVVRFAIPES